MPSARQVAAISLSTEFLAPPMVTVPDSGPPGRTTMRSADRGLSMPLSMLRLVSPAKSIGTS